jgi:uncharacterized protein YciI
MATSLTTSYAPFRASLRAGGFNDPPASEWPAALIAAHIICNNDLIAEAAESISRGEPVSYDNEPSVDEAELTRLAERAGDLGGLAVEVARSAARLEAAYLALGARADVQIPVRIRDGDEIARDGTLMPIGKLVEGNASFHLNAHHEQLKALAPPWVSERPSEFDSYQLVMLTRGAHPPALDEAASDALQRQHLGHLAKMRAAGYMTAAGPIDGDDDIAGICLYTVASAEEARALAEDDPAVKAGRLDVRATTWFTRKGALDRM